MIEKSIQVFTENEEEFVARLVGIGTGKNIAKVLVYLANMKKATAREIEQGTDLRQPEVSRILKYLAGKRWIENGEVISERKGRPQKLWRLKLPADRILDTLLNERRAETNYRLERIRKARKYA